MVPYDVLVDPQSIPKHPMFESDDDDVIEDLEDLEEEHEMETVISAKDVSCFRLYLLLRESKL